MFPKQGDLFMQKAKAHWTNASAHQALWCGALAIYCIKKPNSTNLFGKGHNAARSNKPSLLTAQYWASASCYTRSIRRWRNHVQSLLFMQELLSFLAISLSMFCQARLKTAREERGEERGEERQRRVRKILLLIQPSHVTQQYQPVHDSDLSKHSKWSLKHCSFMRQ